MTIKEAIERADKTKPNAFSNDDKVQWLNEVEGMVQTQVFLFAPAQIITYGAYDDEKNTSLLVTPPHDKIYPAYLVAMIDYHNGEYDRYQNTHQMFNAHFGEFMRWFAAVYRPADTHTELYETEQPDLYANVSEEG